MQEETQEYAEEAKLKELVTRYSEFIDFPIYLYVSKEVEVDAPEEEADEAAADEDVSDAEDVTDGEHSLLCTWTLMPDIKSMKEQADPIQYGLMHAFLCQDSKE